MASYVRSRNGELTELSDEVFCIKYPNHAAPIECTYDPAVSREGKAQLVTLGSPVFQQILKECLTRGALCQIMLRPKGDLDVLLKGHFKDVPFNYEGCGCGAFSWRKRPKNLPKESAMLSPN